jgi:hypothetical protein
MKLANCSTDPYPHRCRRRRRRRCSPPIAITMSSLYDLEVFPDKSTRQSTAYCLFLMLFTILYIKSKRTLMGQ